MFSLQKADHALNAAYARVLKAYAKDAPFIAKLKQAQRSWIRFRDAHLAAPFPKADKQGEYGSSYPMCRCTVLTELTEQREKELKVWAEGIPEGDVCNGSVKTAQGYMDHGLPTNAPRARCTKICRDVT